MIASIRVPGVCLGLAFSLALLSCSPASSQLLAPAITPDYSSASNPCALRVMPPTPTAGPPTPTPTPPPTSPFPDDAFPPHIELPARPGPELPAPARALGSALVSIIINPPANYDSPVSQATGLLVSADGLVWSVLDYSRPMEQIEVVLPGGATRTAGIERVDARTGATLLKMDGASLPYAEIGRGDSSLSTGEPVLLLRQYPETGEVIIREGFGAPATNEEARETLFALLPIGSMGGNGTLVVNHEGNLLGMAGPGQWWGTGIVPRGPAPGPPRPAVKAASLRSLLEADPGAEVPPVPAAISYHGQNWGHGIDFPVTRELLARPARKAMRGLGRPATVENLGQDSRSVLGYRPGSVLELVYARPQELWASDGQLVGQARYLAFWWDREEGKPDVVLCGVVPETASAAFLAGDLAELKMVAGSAPASGRSMVEVGLLSGYPFDYPLKWRVAPEKESYRPGDEVTFTVTIENLSDWPMNAYHLPPVLEVRKEHGPGPWWQSDSGRPGDRSYTIPPHQELRLVVPWHQVDHEGNPIPPGRYTVGGAVPGTHGASFSILEE